MQYIKDLRCEAESPGAVDHVPNNTTKNKIGTCNKNDSKQNKRRQATATINSENNLHIHISVKKPSQNDLRKRRAAKACSSETQEDVKKNTQGSKINIHPNTIPKTRNRAGEEGNTSKRR